jgi:hypothetical protein
MSVQRVLGRARTHWPQGICTADYRYRGLGTQRSDDSVNNNPEHLERHICLTLVSGSNPDNEMLGIDAHHAKRHVHAAFAYPMAT